MGKGVEVAEFEGERHGFSVLQPFGEAANQLMRVLRRFVYTTRPTECSTADVSDCSYTVSRTRSRED
jgi:hypothetical protein